jgi:integrase
VGVQFYWRYTTDRKTDRLPIGPYDASAGPRSLTRHPGQGYSLLAARREAERLANHQQATVDDGGVRALYEAKRKEHRLVEQQSLDKLLSDYCDHLKSLHRKSYREAQSIFNVHVRSAWPDKVLMPATRISPEDIADIMRRVIEQGKGRTANKLRSYIRAAYQTAKAAKTKATIPVHFKDYRITSNPAADTEPDERFNRANKNPLSRDELRAYWRAIRHEKGIAGAVLRLHLLTGGQRIEQLVRLRTRDIQPNAITLYDGKGRPGRPPRPHLVPLTRHAKAALAKCAPKGEFALSTAGGETHIANTTLSAWAAAAVGDAIPEFTAKRIRSGVETLLASLGVSQEVRGRLQSHGVSGVQARHYDGHDYMPEKMKALQLLKMRVA